MLGTTYVIFEPTGTGSAGVPAFKQLPGPAALHSSFPTLPPNSSAGGDGKSSGNMMPPELCESRGCIATGCSAPSQPAAPRERSEGKSKEKQGLQAESVLTSGELAELAAHMKIPAGAVLMHG